MTNHIHLLLTPKYANSAASLMKHLGQRYVQYINRTYQRSGTFCNGQERQRHYRELLQDQIEPHLLEEIRSSMNGNYTLGNELFREEIAQILD